MDNIIVRISEESYEEFRKRKLSLNVCARFIYPSKEGEGINFRMDGQVKTLNGGIGDANYTVKYQFRAKYGAVYTSQANLPLRLKDNYLDVLHDTIDSVERFFDVEEVEEIFILPVIGGGNCNK